jgi:hypothetical protein
MIESPLAATRRGLHGLAELVLAGPQYRRSGTIRLLVRPGGFGTVAAPSLLVEGAELVAGSERLPIAGRTCAQLAAAVGVDVGAPEGVYHDGAGVAPDEVLEIETEAAGYLERSWSAGDTALRRLVPDQEPILWPEHFDVAVLAGGSGFGVSPGDRYFSEPYAYVSPGIKQRGEFWNAPFGAARSLRELDGGDPEAVLAFFTEGRSLLS